MDAEPGAAADAGDHPVPPGSPATPTPRVDLEQALADLDDATMTDAMSWLEADGDLVAEPDRNWTNVIAVAIVVVVVVGGFLGARALLDAAEDRDAGGPRRTEDAESGIVDAEDAPTLEELTAAVTLPPGPEEGLTVVEQAVTIVPDRFDPEAREGSVVVIIENPHDAWRAHGVQVSIDLLGTDGTSLGRRSGFAEVVLPGQEVAIAILLLEAPTEEITGIDVAVDVSRWDESGPIEGGFRITEVETTEAEFTGVVTTFTIESEFDDVLRDVGVTAVYRDEEGAIVGGYDTFIDRLAPGRPVEAEIALLANVDPEIVATTELYPSPTFTFGEE